MRDGGCGNLFLWEWTMARVLGIIPARAGSKRLPGKNMLPISGKPMAGWVIEAALGAYCFDRLVVSSDAPEVLALAAEYGAALPLERPAALAADHSPAVDYVRHALEVCEREDGCRYDVTVIMQVTSPLTQSRDVDGTVALLESSGADTAVSVTNVDFSRHPAKLKLLDGDRLLPFLEEEGGRMAAHELPELWVRNGSVYASRREVAEAGQVIGNDCRAYVMPRNRSVSINEDMDYLFAQFLMERLLRERGADVAG